MTVIGIVIIGIGFFFYLKKPIRYLLALILVSCIFQASSVINIGGKGIPPYVICELFLVLRVLSTYSSSTKRLKVNRVIIYFFVFVCWAIVLTLFMPFVFKGLSVIGSNTSDQYLAMMQMHDHLSFSSKNIVQIMFIISNFVTFCLFYHYRDCLSNKFLLNTFLCAIGLVLFIGFWSFSNKILGVPFPNSVFYSNVGYGQLYNVETEFGLSRLNATFTEPSYCGGFLAASFWAVYNTANKHKYILCSIIMIALLFNLSSTGLVAFGVGFILYAVSSVKRLFINVIIFIVLIFILSHTIYWDYFDTMLFSKGETLSGLARGNSLILTLDLCRDTHFIGLGLGSHSDFSFFGNLLAATGIVGLVLFMVIVGILQYKNYKNRNVYVGNRFLFYWGNVHWIAVFIALPDLSYSVLWMWMFASISQYKSIKYADWN